MRILSGDIGGTKTRLAIRIATGGELVPGPAETYASREYPSLTQIARHFLAMLEGPVDAACFGVAGPVREGRCRTTNLPWIVDARELARDLEIPRVELLNDLEAMAWAIPILPPSSFEALAAGEPDPAANAALIAAGTGLGEAGLAWNGQRLAPFATEGGHTSFAPTSELEIALLHYLAKRYEHVSWERVVSGPGLITLHEFLTTHRRAPVPPWLAEEMRTGDPAAAISRAALAERDELAGEALDLFVHLYGAEAGNLALKMMARRGVFLGGGIAAKILPRLRGSVFLAAFAGKGRMRPLLEAMPVQVLLDEGAPLTGAAAAVLATMGGDDR